MPDDIVEQSVDRDSRSCVEEVETGKRWLEVTWQGRQSLFCMLDMGSVGWNSKYPLFDNQRGRLRGDLQCDSAHRWHDNMLNSVQKSGLTWARLEILVLCVVTSGPFAGGAHFGTVQDAGRERVANFSHKSVLWDIMYGRIAFEMHEGQLPTHFGSEKHRAEIWLRTQQSWVLQRKGGEIENGALSPVVCKAWRNSWALGSACARAHVHRRR